MKLDQFIDAHIEEILSEWETFARTQTPAATSMSSLALRNHSRAILKAIALDIRTQQNPEQQFEKSQGRAPDAEAQTTAAAIHGALRQASYFSLPQLGAEFRALRATVLRLWLPEVTHMSAATANEMIRFNEAIDQALAESISTYSAGADHARELFLAILGHDLRAPLSTIVMAGELLMRSNPDQQQSADIGARVRRSGRLMGSMVDDLLGFTRTALGGGIPVTRRPGDVGEVCRSAVEDASAVHPSTRFEIETGGELGGNYDYVRLHQLFTNLCVNAAQYGDDSGVVRIVVCGDAQAITITVTNFGAVIAGADLENIFRPLVQLEQDEADDTRPATSLGLGLFVAREIAVGHGGTIGATSSEGDGTTFTVRLPRSAEPASGGAAPA